MADSVDVDLSPLWIERLNLRVQKYNDSYFQVIIH